ncbi:MAG: pyruvate, phosphate dikinase [Myxococcales bacterium]|nr:pyruvate, phosphate dikinase [Myxococcales bacterium]
MSTTTRVYAFEDEVAAGRRRALLGGKGAGLQEMTRLGIPVPPGFTIATEVGPEYRRLGGPPAGLEAEVEAALARLEARLDRRLGASKRPLLVSVRSGAATSMPGMMDTILNLGLNDETVEALARESGDRRFAFDAYRRFTQMYGDVVMGVDHHLFEDALGAVKLELGSPRMLDSELDAAALEELVARYRRILIDRTGTSLPEAPREQLWAAIGAVFRSWDNVRAVRYRKMQGVVDPLGTACTVQAMVFGNLGETSGSGVAFTRNPSTGERMLYGEYLPNAQGEDVVAGIRTPVALTATASVPGREQTSLERRQPDVFAQIEAHCAQLEAHFGDMQDIEFTVQEGEPFILQTRSGKRTATAAVRIAVDMVGEGAIDEDRAVQMVDASSLDQLLHARLPDPELLEARGTRAVARGLPASPGAATGRIVLDADEAVRLAAVGETTILVRRETSPEDIHGMKAAAGILTATGGMTSHAAVVARGLGTCCVVGCSALAVDYEARTIAVARGEADEARVFSAGDTITLDGVRGLVYAGAVDAVAAASIPEYDVLMQWADARRRMEVRANADTPRAAREAAAGGAAGIGLCRTEHMFFSPERIDVVRAMLLAEADADADVTGPSRRRPAPRGSAGHEADRAREPWLDKIEPMQRADFEAIFDAMEGRPVTIRLLDWPLHEILPHGAEEQARVADLLGVDRRELARRVERHKEQNPMLGHRGVRLGLTMPGLYRMQARAILSAALACVSRGVAVKPELMIPIVGFASEIEAARALIDAEASALFERVGRRVEYRVGTMIELPRACVCAGSIAEHAEFFSFGTNDLTQTTLGISRDDSAGFLPAYRDRLGLIAADPFAELDADGVGALMALAVERGRQTRRSIKIGVCGEQGGDPRSIAIVEKLGLDYVSCSVPRLPIARLAAAQARLVAKHGEPG